MFLTEHFTASNCLNLRQYKDKTRGITSAEKYVRHLIDTAPELERIRQLPKVVDYCNGIRKRLVAKMHNKRNDSNEPNVKGKKSAQRELLTNVHTG